MTKTHNKTLTKIKMYKIVTKTTVVWSSNDFRGLFGSLTLNYEHQ